MSSGAKVVAAFIRETTPGITPTAGAWNLLRRSSFGLKPTQNTNDNDEIAGDRMAQGVSRGTVNIGGDVGTRFRWNQHDDFLASCFGSEWVNNVLTMGNGRITFSVATFASDVGIAQIARGCQVGTFNHYICRAGLGDEGGRYQLFHHASGFSGGAALLLQGGHEHPAEWC